MGSTEENAALLKQPDLIYVEVSVGNFSHGCPYWIRRQRLHA